MGTVEPSPAPRGDHSLKPAKAAKGKLAKAIDRLRGKKEQAPAEKIQRVADSAAFNISVLTNRAKTDHRISSDNILKHLEKELRDASAHGSDSMAVQIASAAYDAAKSQHMPNEMIQAAEKAAIEKALEVSEKEVGKEGIQKVADRIIEELQDYEKKWDFESAITMMVQNILGKK